MFAYVLVEIAYSRIFHEIRHSVFDLSKKSQTLKNLSNEVLSIISKYLTLTSTFHEVGFLSVQEHCIGYFEK